MLVNVSYNNKELIKKIDEVVGKPFKLKERWAMGGNGSPKLFIAESSPEIEDLLNLNNNIHSCNIEMRPLGIIVRFRSLLETFALIIPYYKLTIFKGDASAYSIYRDNHFIKVKSDNKAIPKFIRKILNYKTTHAPVAIEDL